MKPLDEWTDSELTEMTGEQFEQLVTSELMEAGILKPSPAQLIDVESVPAPSTTFYRVKLCAGYREESFMARSIEDATRIVEVLQDVSVYREGYASGDYNTKIPEPIDSVETVAVKCYSQSEFEGIKDLKLRAEKAKKHNDEETRRHQKEVDATQTITDDIHDRISAAHTRIAAHNRIFATWDEYLETCDGESSTAMKFLLKVYPREQIAAAQAFDPGRVTGRLPAVNEPAADPGV